MKYNREQIQKTLEDKGYKYFKDSKNKGHDVNIIGIRNSDTNGKVTNRFDDLLTISYKSEEGEWIYKEFKCTTDPGTHWVENVLNENGVAILKPGQYRGSHKIRKHQGKYEALCQQKKLPVYRDNNLDGVYDLNESTLERELIGINIHRATKWVGKTSTQIDKWSAGCQVIASNDDFHEFMEICYSAKDIWGNSFTYTLIESNDIKS